MSSGSRRGPSEENILAMLERDAARRRLGGTPRFALYAVAGVLTLSLVGALAWLLHENNNANDVLRLNEQAGVSVAVVPDKPGQPPAAAAAPGPAFSDELQPNLHTVAAATIIDSPEPAAPRPDDARLAAKPVQPEAPRVDVKLAHAEVPAVTVKAAPAEPRRMDVKLAKAEVPGVAVKPARSEAPPVAAKPAPAEAPRVAARPAHEDVPPLVLLPPAEAAKARGGSAPRDAAPKKAPAHESATAHDASRTASPARPASTAHGASPAREETRRVAPRERASDADAPAHSTRTATAKAAARARPAASTPSKGTVARNASRARARKAAPTETHEAPVDTDVALISAIIMHADGHSQRADPCAAAPDKKCAGNGGTQP
jgi:hypothetical protein